MISGVLTQSNLFTLALVAIIVLSLGGYRLFGKTDVEKFIWTQIIAVSSTVLGVFIGTILAFEDRVTAEKQAAAAAMRPYGTSSIFSRVQLINNWIGYGEQYKNDIAKFLEIQDEINADFKDLKPVDALSKISENQYVAIYLPALRELQDFRVADEQIVRSLKRMDKPDQFCERMKEMQKYLQYLIRFWEFSTKSAYELGQKEASNADFKGWFAKKSEPNNPYLHDTDQLACSKS
jgi:hypothetical protein